MNVVHLFVSEHVHVCVCMHVYVCVLILFGYYSIIYVINIKYIDMNYIDLSLKCSFMPKDSHKLVNLLNFESLVHYYNDILKIHHGFRIV